MFKEEVWKDIRGFEGLYQVSSKGRIRSLYFNNTDKVGVRKQVRSRKGKMEVNLWKNNKAYPKTVARVVFETFSGRRLRKNQIIKYFDGDSENCSFENLYVKAKIRRPKLKKRTRTFKDETWKDIKGYEGLYQVSDMGRIKCLNYRRTKKEQIKRASNTNWYTIKVNLSKDGTRKDYGVAKLVYETFTGISVTKDKVIRYRDGNAGNCRLDNLYVISMSKEVLDEYERGTRKRAEFEYYDLKLTIRDISEMSDIPVATVWSRLKTQNWNVYETVETPLALNKKRKERLKNGKA